jgi:hypothetical protein
MSEERASRDKLGPMIRSTMMLWICVGLGACSSFSETAELPPPDGEKLLEGVTKAISDSHFQPPIEVTDPIRAQANSTPPWMVCIRSAQSEETRRITYTAFFKDGYTGSRYSAITDGCAAQAYHLFQPPQPPSPPKTNTRPKRAH